MSAHEEIDGLPNETYVPTWQPALEVWKQLAPKERAARYEEARQRREAIEAVKAQHNESERRAISAIGCDRSNYRRWKARYDAHGFDGLLSLRLPPTPEKMPESIVETICQFRRADAEFPIEKIQVYLSNHKAYEASTSVIKRVLKDAGLSRRPGPPAGNGGQGKGAVSAKDKGVPLQFGGMVLLEAASEATGCLDALTQTVIDAVDAMPSPSRELPVDQTGRDEQGRFQSAYNERYRKREGALIGPGFVSVADKRDHIDKERLHVNGANGQTVARKLWALLCSPLIGRGGWDGMRNPQGECLKELCGYPYMPATLDLFVRELKYVGVSDSLWERHAQLWLNQSAQWGDATQAAIVYVDGTTKGIWTRLPSEQTSVSHLGRVMPGLEVVSFHSGYGAPLWMATSSGRAPLPKVVGKYLNQLDRVFDKPETMRIVVIDGEGCAVPFLAELEETRPARGWVTLISPWHLRGKQIQWQTDKVPYRQHDWLREGTVYLNHHKEKTAFLVRVVELSRKSGKQVTLAASQLLDATSWSGETLADLYFSRYTNQEASFRQLSQGMDFKRVRGYGKKLVTNITVVNELSTLSSRAERAEQRLEKRYAALAEQERTHAQLQDTEVELQKALSTLSETFAQPADTKEEALKAMCNQQCALVDRLLETQRAIAKTTTAREHAKAQVMETTQQVQRMKTKHDDLSHKERIFQHDTETDSLFNVLKVTLLMLIRYVLKEYFGDYAMQPETFLHRFAPLTGTRTSTADYDTLHFDHNRRDPELMSLLRKHSDAINNKQLRLRNGKRLRITVAPEPPPRIPPPNSPADRTERSNTS